MSYSRAPIPLEVVPTVDDSTSSLVDVDSPHISTVPSDYESQSVKTDTQAERIEREETANARREAQAAADKAKQKGRKAKSLFQANSDNPVLLGNAVTVGLLGTFLGVGAYRKYAAGELTWKVAGLWAGAVGVFAGVDYFVTQ